MQRHARHGSDVAVIEVRMRYQGEVRFDPWSLDTGRCVGTDALC